MMHAAALALCWLGFAALAFGTRRPQHEIIGRSLRRGPVRALRAVGAAALLIALAVLVDGKGWSVGLVMFSCHTTLAAAIVYVALIGSVQAVTRRARS